MFDAGYRSDERPLMKGVISLPITQVDQSWCMFAITTTLSCYLTGVSVLDFSLFMHTVSFSLHV